jgi:hypothetical protein
MKQALFELTGNQMTRPVQTIKRFIRPLVDKAIERDQDGGKEKGEKGKGVLLDHLVKVMKGVSETRVDAHRGS